HGPVDGGARHGRGRSDRRGEGVALAHAEVSAAGCPAPADAGGCPHLPRDAGGDLCARLLQGVRSHRSRHVLGVSRSAGNFLESIRSSTCMRPTPTTAALLQGNARETNRGAVALASSPDILSPFRRSGLGVVERKRPFNRATSQPLLGTSQLSAPLLLRP